MGASNNGQQPGPYDAGRTPWSPQQPLAQPWGGPPQVQQGPQPQQGLQGQLAGRALGPMPGSQPPPQVTPQPGMPAQIPGRAYGVPQPNGAPQLAAALMGGRGPQPGAPMPQADPRVGRLIRPFG